MATMTAAGVTGEDRPLDPDAVADGLLAATLTKAEWTHAGHLAACVGLVRRLGATAALDTCRRAIPRLNEAHGVVNDDGSGYHETITVFYVAAVAAALARGLAADDVEDELGRDAPLMYWSRDRLLSVEARRGWVEPDRAPLPFPLP